MLASIIPGLRDLRVPLACGFLWLVALWLLIYDDIPTEQEATGIAAEIYRLFGALGPASLLAVLSFVAYLIGIVLGKLSLVARLYARPAMYRRLFWRRSSGSEGFAWGSMVMSRESIDQTADLAKREIQNAHEAGVTYAHAAMTASGRRLNYDEATEAIAEEGRLSEEGRLEYESGAVRALQWKIYDEIPLIAVRLLATEKKELFDRYDRADAEANFRYTIVIPLAVIAILLARDLPGRTAPWLLVVIYLAVFAFLALILRDAFVKQRESNDAIAQAVILGAVDVPIFEELKSLAAHPAYNYESPHMPRRAEG